MLKDFNLIGTTMRWSERGSRYELRYLLEQIGDSSAMIDKTGIAGLIVAKTVLDPLEAIEKLRAILHERPYEFRYLLRVIPIQKIISTNLAEIKKTALEFSSKIGEDETFRVTVEKRFTDLHTRDIIEAAAATIKNKVDLNKPDKILLIEVIGGSTGVTIAKPESVISVLKEKML